VSQAAHVNSIDLVQADASAVVGTDSLEVVAPGLSTPGEKLPGCVGLLALGGLDSIGRVRVGIGRLGQVRPLPVLGLSGPGRVGTGRAGLHSTYAGPVSGRYNPGCEYG
jgi:hypothetical protein